MTPRITSSRPIARSAEPQQASGVDHDLARIDGMNADALRPEWRRVFGSEPPPAFSKNLLAPAIAYRLQEGVLGGLNPATTRLLRSLMKPGTEPPRQVKVGSVIVREHKGVVHEVMVVPGGFCWQGKTYDSLSTVAKKITGVTWNGPRFFGLRSKKQPAADVVVSTLSDETADKARSVPTEPVRRRAGRQSSLRSLSSRSGVGA